MERTEAEKVNKAALEAMQEAVWKALQKPMWKDFASDKWFEQHQWQKENPHLPKSRQKQNVRIAERASVYHAIQALEDAGFPIEWRRDVTSAEIEIRFDARDDAEKVKALQKDNEQLKKQTVRFEDLYMGADAEAKRLFIENERLKKELEEVKALSLF